MRTNAQPTAGAVSALTLRPYQAAAIEAAREKIRAGRRRIVVVSPTGSGKTVLASFMIRSAVERSQRIMFLAHRKELITQCSDKLDALGIEHGIIMADHPRWIPHAPVQVASVQTLIGRIKETSRRKPTPPSLIFIDEAHHARAASYQKILDAYPDAVSIGLTATPWRSDGKGLGELFEDMVVAATVKELTALGSLVPASGFSFKPPSLAGVQVARGDYNLEQLDGVMNGVIITGDLVREWKAHAEGKTTVAFAVNVKHSKLIVYQFCAAGIPAEHVDANTPSHERDAILARLRAGTIKLVSNVGILTEGWDLPAAEVCILARPTKSLSLALQMMGRVLRPWPGKEKARIHDHAGVLFDHGTPAKDREYSLEYDSKKTPVTLGRTCSACFAFNEGRPTVCQECGFPFAINEGKEREIKNVAGEMVDLDEVDELIARREKLQLRELTPEQARKVAGATDIERMAEYLRLREVQQARGFKPGFVDHQYREIWGKWPRFTEEQLAGVEPARKPFLPLPPRVGVGAAAKEDELAAVRASVAAAFGGGADSATAGLAGDSAGAPERGP